VTLEAGVLDGEGVAARLDGIELEAPEGPVAASRVAAVVSEVSLTLTAGIWMPLLSSTAPVMEPVTFWARVGRQKNGSHRRRRSIVKPVYF